ncbi:MAG: oligosaccharide flippase family protein, partial [Gammaproteobacteria bacterium]|nr:oligosaccharide flippase family protein [Gammaproteobacteria bacterium]
MVEQQAGQLKKTAKHSVIYALGTMLRRLTGLIMLPVYTRYLTPSDYGVVELLGMAIEIAGILIGLRISQAMFRYYILADSEKEKHEIVSTVLFTVIVTSALGAGALFYLADFLAEIIFGNLKYVFELKLFALTLVTNAIAAVGLSYLRAKQLPVLFITINITSLLIQVCLNVYLVVIHDMHVTGVVYSAVISGAMLSAGLMLYVLVNVGFHYSGAITIKLIKFIAPLIIASIGAFYVSYADKYFLRLFGSL